MEAVGAASISMRVYYSGYHLWAARHFTRLAQQIEDAHSGRSTFNIVYRTYVTGTILSTVGFIEAAVNELFQDAADGYDSYIRPLGKQHVQRLANLWTAEAERVPYKSVLDKYQTALDCLGEPTIAKGSRCYQRVKLIIKLRNALTHFRPESRGHDSLDKMAKALKNQNFPLNRLMHGSKGNSFFPDHCLGAGCATWAVESAITFADEFFGRLAVRPHYQTANLGAA